MRIGTFQATPNTLLDQDNIRYHLVDAQGRLLVSGAGGSGPTAATGTVTAVADNAASVTLLAANTARKGATIVNTSTALLYVKCGATATTASFTVILNTNQYWECPFGYTGVIDGIWASDPNTGSAVVTEFT